MSKDEKETAAEATPKKSKKLLMIVAIALVVLGGGGAGAYFAFKSDPAEATAEPVKGSIVTIDDPLTINLADGHYLKVGFALQQTEEAGEEEVDVSEALNLAIDQYTGMSIEDLSTEQGREHAKEALLEKIEKAYEEDGKHMIMDIYFTSFVTQ